MDHGDHVALLRPGVPAPQPGSTWADIGAGRGAFTLALADLLGPGARILAVDRDATAVAEAVDAAQRRFTGVRIEALVADFRGALDLPILEGLVMANSLHFVPRGEQAAVVRSLAGRLRPGGTFLLVEYDADRGNPWVPHPFSFKTWRGIAAAAGLEGTALAGRVPSRFLGAIYSAVSRRPASPGS
ncbi:MAG TPA: class I SAM-dependent methyltransferase [Candidatus Limnocylindrales bacterium]|jgi:SAM-dependent methyltransferase